MLHHIAYPQPTNKQVYSFEKKYLLTDHRWVAVGYTGLMVQQVSTQKKPLTSEAVWEG